MKVRQRLSWQIPIAILLISPLWQGAASHFLRIEPNTSWPAPRQQGSQFSMDDIVFSQAKRGIHDILLRAKHLEGTDEGQGFDLDEAYAQRLSPQAAHIRGGHAHYDVGQAILTVVDDVVVKTPDLQVTTQALRFLSRFQTVKSAAEVAMQGEGFSLTGTSFMYNLATGDLRVGQRVSFLFSPIPPQPPPGQ